MGILGAIGAGLVAGVFVAGTWLGGTSSAPLSGPQAWIDAPLHESVLPVAPYTVVAHATSPGGVVSAEFAAIRAVEDPLASPDPWTFGKLMRDMDGHEGTLASFVFEWAPPGPGVYDLLVRSADTENTYGPAAVARITVPSVTPPTTTTTITAPPPTTTTTNTTTPTSTTTQAADSAGPGISRVSGTPEIFYQGTAGCGPTAVTITALVTDPSGVGASF